MINVELLKYEFIIGAVQVVHHQSQGSMEKIRKEEKEKERKEGKGREFIPVEMALTGDAN